MMNLKRSKIGIAITVAFSMLVGSLTGVSVNSPVVIKATNPIVQDLYTADPAPMVCSDGRLYVYTSHDEDETVNGFFTMNDWKCYSTTDMVNWTDHGTILGYNEFSWAKPNTSWAGQVVERNNKFYYYVPISAKNGTTAIGVAVSDSPTGPFVDPIGAPLVGPAPNYIDPTVFIDDDGQAYLYWGNPDLFCVLLNDDMISYDTDKGIIRWDLETNDYKELANITDKASISNGSYNENVSDACKDAQAQFGIGTRVDNGKVRRPTLYEEGPWFYKRNDHYYMIYAANGIPERIDYSMADSPLGPWVYKGMIMDDNVNGTGTGSFTNHPGIVDYKGHSYMFYHTGKLPDGGGYHRSVAVEEITYNDEDGTINPVDFTAQGTDAIETLNPFEKVEAETVEWGEGIEKEPCSNGGVNLCELSNNDSIRVKNVDFSQYGAVKFTACTAADPAVGESAGTIEVRLDSKDGELLTEYEVKAGDRADTWVTNTVDIDKTVANGVHDLYMIFKGQEGYSNLFKFDYWQFTQDEIPATPSPVPTAVPTTVPTSIPTSTPVIAATQAPTVSPVIAPVTESPIAAFTAPAKIKISQAKPGVRKITLTWKKANGANGYRITYSANKSFKKSVKKITSKKTSLTIKKLKKKKIYYVKVQAFKVDTSGKKHYGKYSAVAKIKTK